MLEISGCAWVGGRGGCGGCLFLELQVLGLVIEFIVGSGEFVWEGYVPRGSEEEDVGAVFVFHTENGPQASSTDFGEGNHETQHRGVLYVVGKDGVEDPVESHNYV